MAHIFCAHNVSKAVQNTHKMADGWLQFETEPSVLYTIVFSRSCQKSRMGKLQKSKCQIPSLRFCSMVSSKHFSQVKFHSKSPNEFPRDFPEILEPSNSRIGYFSGAACGSIDMV